MEGLNSAVEIVPRGLIEWFLTAAHLAAKSLSVIKKIILGVEGVEPFYPLLADEVYRFIPQS